MPKSAKLGQNFLRDANYARRIVGLLETSAAPLLEIGAGHGVLSELLLEKFPGRPVTLVEIDPALVDELEGRFAGRARIFSGDILQIDLEKLYPQKRVAVVGNLPYHISKLLVDWFIAQREKIGVAVLMLQKDFVDKLLAPQAGPAGENHKKYNAQSVVFQLLFRARRCFDVPAGAFKPAPKITSTVLAVQPAESPLPADMNEFYDFVRHCFAERRKTLWNNLSPHFGAATLTSAFAAVAIPAQARAEQLPPAFFLALFSDLKKWLADRP